MFTHPPFILPPPSPPRHFAAIAAIFRHVFDINKNIDHMNLTLNVFELHQYLVSLLRKTQNTFSEQAVKKIGWWEFFPKKEIYYQTLGHINRTMNLCELHLYLISLLRKMQNIFPELEVSGIWLMGFFSQKENFSPKHRSHK